MDLLLLRRLHKWVGLVLGLQLVLWTVSGAAMAWIDHRAVAGDGLSHDKPLRPNSARLAPLTDLIAAPMAGDVRGLRAYLIDGQLVTEVTTQGGRRLLDAYTGSPVTIDQAKARAIAAGAYAGDGDVKGVTHHATPPLEAREAPGPLWAVAFEDTPRTTFYVAQETGEIVEKRSRAYRAWDFFWMLHNMDYANRSSFNHPLIIAAALGAVWIALTGVLMLFKVFHARDFVRLAWWRR